MHTVERACIPNNLCWNSLTCILNNYAGISSDDVINDMTSLAASLWTLYSGGGGGGGVTY